ncbi:hypothetical protein ABZ402_09040 [Streptomyces mirabilis]|uniref:hypothetical protein n=1 Tax=Streptomyces mirabilis TaxID=68239 RepID=UPI0033E298B8
MRAEVIANFAMSGAGYSGPAVCSTPHLLRGHLLRPLQKGLKLIDPRRTVTARKVLGLTTNPPSNDEGGGGRGNGGSGGGLEV